MNKILAIVYDQETLKRIETIIPEVFPNIMLYTASFGSDGIEMAGTYDPDVILLDHHLKEESGLEICRALKSDRQLREIPIVFLTYYATDREIRKEVLETGVDAFLYKPIDEVELTAQLRVLIKLESTIREQRLEIKRRIQLEESLQESEVHYRILADNGQALIWTSGTDKLCDYFNKPWLDFTGKSLEQELGFGWAEGVHPDDLQRCVDIYVKAFDSREKFSMEYRVLHVSGQYRWILDDGTPRYNNKGEFIGYIGHCLDVTDQRVAREALIRSEERFIQVAKSSGIWVWEVDAMGRYTYCSESEESILGYKAEEIIGMYFHDFSVPEIREEMTAKTMEIFAQKGLLSNMEHPCVHKDGHLVVLEKFGAPIIDHEGNLTGYRGADKDISERIISEAELENSISRLKKHEEELNNKNTFIQTVLDNLPLGIALNQIDNGTALYENKRFVEIYGWPEEELKDISTFFQKVYPDEKYRTELTSRVMGDIQSGDSHRMKWADCRITHKDGSIHYVNAANIPLYDQNMMVSTVFDITEQHKNREELILAKDKAEESNRLKSSFLSNMSHEIRTPMNAISGFSSLLAEASDEEKMEYAEIIQKCSAQLLTIVDDVLLLSRLQSEKLPVIFSQFSPAGLVHSVSQLFQIPGQNSNLEFKVTVPEEFRGGVYLADENKIMQVLTCLASNAVKYTHSGCVEVGFNIENNLIEFFVKDTGIGISESDQQRIFDTFFRTEQAIALAIRGTGLGLNIAKELVILMGGQIGVQSAPGQGSRFYFTVPVEQLDLESHNWSTSQAEENKYSDLNILIVDDELINCQLVELFLRGLVRNIDFAFDGQEAVEKASKKKYDLVLMDIKMPEMGGLEATMILKNRYPEMKIIAQTAFTLPEEQELAFQAGCDDFLTKPILKKKLMEKFINLGF